MTAEQDSTSAVVKGSATAIDVWCCGQMEVRVRAADGPTEQSEIRRGRIVNVV